MAEEQLPSSEGEVKNEGEDKWQNLVEKAELVEDKDKAREMAEAENPYRTIAKNQRDKGETDKAYESLDLGRKVGEIVGEKHDKAREKEVKQGGKFLENRLKALSGIPNMESKGPKHKKTR